MSPSFGHYPRPSPSWCGLGAGALLCKIASTSRNKCNVDRNLRRCIYKTGISIKVDMRLVPTTIRLRKPRVRVKNVFWPCFSMRSWISVLAEKYPKIMLGGFRLEQEVEWRNLFRWFWGQFRECDPQHPVFDLESQGVDLSMAVPFMTHGDEGRGLRSQAFMVEAFQFVISHLGPMTTNTSGKLGLVRFLYKKIKCIFILYIELIFRCDL